MENISWKKRMLGFLKGKEVSFSTHNILPVIFIFFAFSAMSLQASHFSVLLQATAVLLFISSCLWSFKGLVFSVALSCVFFIVVSPNVFLSFSSLIFFLIMITTGVIVVLLKKNSIITQKSKREELERLKIWESHYYAFRHEFLDELAAVRDTQEDLFFIDQELQSLEKERIEELLEEDTCQKALVELFIASQKKVLALEQEVELLEEILLNTFKVQVKPRLVQKEKSKEKDRQWTLF